MDHLICSFSFRMNFALATDLSVQTEQYTHRTSYFIYIGEKTENEYVRMLSGMSYTIGVLEKWNSDIVIPHVAQLLAYIVPDATFVSQRNFELSPLSSRKINWHCNLWIPPILTISWGKSDTEGSKKILAIALRNLIIDKLSAFYTSSQEHVPN